VQPGERLAGRIVQVGEPGDLPGQPSQIGGVVVGPPGHGPVPGTAIAFRLHPCVAGRTGLIRRISGAAQVATFGRLPARDAQRRGEGLPGDPGGAGGSDQGRLYVREFVLRPAVDLRA
jgi:hypothetical protein